MKFSLSIGLGFGILSAVHQACARPSRRGPLATVYTSCKEPNTAALTFDDGPWLYMYDISKTLVAAGARASFMVNGNNYDCIYDDNGKRLKYLYEKGHHIVSHTWSHPDLTTLSWDEIHDQMWRVEEAMQKILGVTPAFMRPPYGNYNDLVREAAYVRNQSLVLWDFDSGDSTGSTPEQSEAAYQDLVNSDPINILALNHETVETTAHQVLPYAIQLLQSRGYKLVTVPGESGYDSLCGIVQRTFVIQNALGYPPTRVLVLQESRIQPGTVNNLLLL
ncbi:Carbohydrate esterase 4 protein [Tulasnella sp. 403]|nr:Carbohydrate esterase 4 protein [Tulasnella sp. 403]